MVSAGVLYASNVCSIQTRPIYKKNKGEKQWNENRNIENLYKCVRSLMVEQRTFNS